VRQSDAQSVGGLQKMTKMRLSGCRISSFASGVFTAHLQVAPVVLLVNYFWAQLKMQSDLLSTLPNKYNTLPKATN
jgi:hypothetical protein